MLDRMNGRTRLTTDLILNEYLFLLTGGELIGFFTVEWDKGATLYSFIHIGHEGNDMNHPHSFALDNKEKLFPKVCKN